MSESYQTSFDLAILRSRNFAIMPREYSRHQHKIISRYYENRDQIDEQKLSELVTNLFLATGKKQIAKHWETAENAMTRLGVPESRIKHVIESKDPTVLAAVVEELQKGTLKLEKPKGKTKQNEASE